VRRPVIPDGGNHNAHMYYLLLRDLDDRSAFIQAMKAEDIHCVFHYVPLHSAPQGQKIGRMADALTVTTDLANRLVRLPLWLGLDEEQGRVMMRLILRLNLTEIRPLRPTSMARSTGSGLLEIRPSG